jgi:hypothetical protein
LDVLEEGRDAGRERSEGDRLFGPGIAADDHGA